MIVLGINNGETRFGKKLKDGGVCIVRDGKVIFAAAEERFSRIKHDGGFSSSLKGALSWLNLDLTDIDLIVKSSCCDVVAESTQFDYENKSVPASRVRSVSHHLSHAYSTFVTSPFKESLVVIMDAGGNILESTDENDWWKFPREQVSYYKASGSDISLIERDFDKPYEVGFGEMYRAFTHYLGWPSHTLSANTMALAAFAHDRTNRFKDFSLFEFDDGNLVSRLINDPNHPVKMIQKAAEAQNIVLPPPRCPTNELSYIDEDSGYCELAGLVQAELEKALVAKVTHLVRVTGITNLCIAGGVGLNCVVNKKLLDETPIQNIFIQPASGDDGQALGNALYGYYHLGKNPRNNLSKFNPYLGVSYDLSFHEVQSLDYGPNSLELIFEEFPHIAQKAAELLQEGKVVAWYQGRSEFGPRALGNRSILADPRQAMNTERCHKIKRHHELFRPFAPSVIKERASEYFELNVESPYMLLVANVINEFKDKIPGVVHVDGSARLQTVESGDNPLFYNLLIQFEKLTGVPVLLNTSFNRRGEPIVESPQDAVDCFIDADIDALVIGNVLVEKQTEASSTHAVEAQPEVI